MFLRHTTNTQIEWLVVYERDGKVYEEKLFVPVGGRLEVELKELGLSIFDDNVVCEEVGHTFK